MLSSFARDFLLPEKKRTKNRVMFFYSVSFLASSTTSGHGKSYHIHKRWSILFYLMLRCIACSALDHVLYYVHGHRGLNIIVQRKVVHLKLVIKFGTYSTGLCGYSKLTIYTSVDDLLAMEFGAALGEIELELEQMTVFGLTHFVTNLSSI